MTRIVIKGKIVRLIKCTKVNRTVEYLFSIKIILQITTHEFLQFITNETIENRKISR